MLLVEDISIRYHRSMVIENVGFALDGAHSAAITGPSGGGKSSILSAILGLVAPAQGTIRFDGHDIRQHSRKARRHYFRNDVSAVFQDGELIDELPPVENVAIAAMLAGVHYREAHEKASALLDDLSLRTTAQRTDQLSGGERQRVAVARALITQPRLVVADEPTGSLDSESASAVGDMICSIPERWGASLLLVTHDPHLAAATDREYRIAISPTGTSRWIG